MSTRKTSVRIALGVIASGSAIGLAAWCGLGEHVDSGPISTVSRLTPGSAAETAGQRRAMTFGFDRSADAEGIPGGWTAIVSRGRMQVAVKRMPELSNERALWMKSENASFLLANRSQPFDPAVFQIVRWSWMATSLPDGGDVRKNSLLFGANCNDQALQLLVAFENKRVLSYVWDTTAPVETEVDEPSVVATVKTRVVDSGRTQAKSWRAHEVNIYNDYRRRFGASPPPTVSGIIVQTNSNHTGSIGAGWIGPISIVEP